MGEKVIRNQQQQKEAKLMKTKIAQGFFTQQQQKFCKKRKRKSYSIFRCVFIRGLAQQKNNNNNKISIDTS